MKSAKKGDHGKVGPGALAICCSFVFRDHNGFNAVGSTLFWGGLSWAVVWSLIIICAYTRHLSKKQKGDHVNAFRTVGEANRSE